MLGFLLSCLRGPRPRPGSTIPLQPRREAAGHRPGMLDVDGMIRQASTRVSVDQLVRKGKKYIQVLSREKIDELINRAVKTIVDKHRATAIHQNAVSAAKIEADSRAEFEELLLQYQQTADATRAVEHSKKTLEEACFEVEPVSVCAAEPPPATANARPAPDVAASGGDPREIATLKKRIEKLLAHIATMEAALKMLSTAKTFSNQQVQNVLRDLGLAQDDRHFERKKEMLKVVLDENQGIRKAARALAARGISLDAPEEKAVFTCVGALESGLFTRSSV